LERTRVAAPIQKQDRLFLPFEPPCDRFLELRRKNRRATLLAHLQAHIDDANNRHFFIVRACRHRQQSVFAALGVIKTLERRRSRTEHDGRSFHLPANDCNIARVVTRRFFLFVRVLVFLIDDDQAERLDRRKNRRTRADHNAGATLADFVPFIMAFAGRKMTVQNCDQRLQRTGIEAGLETLDRLRRE
jgi:hypothetical protein